MTEVLQRRSASQLWKHEVRAIFWPWCGVVALAFVGFGVHSPQWTDFLNSIRIFGFSVGVPLLATLPLGREFQHRTLPSLLSLPLARERMWAIKTTVGITAAVAAALAHRLTWDGMSAEIVVLAGAWAATSVCAATLCTLSSKSIIGGVATGLMLEIVLATLVVLLTLGSFPPLSTLILTLGPFTAVYCVTTVWLGRRALLRFQFTGPVQITELRGFDSLATRLFFLRRPRCQPAGPLRNLFRKEIGLLWPVWQLTVLAGGVIAVFALGRVVMSLTGRAFPFGLLGIILMAYGGLVAILSGTLSAGEERELGTHAWQGTLPVSPFRQWGIKVLAATLMPLLCSALLFLMAHLLMGPQFLATLTEPIPWNGIWLTAALLIAGVAYGIFWCTAASRGPIEAVLWAIPVWGAIAFAFDFGKTVSGNLLASGIGDSAIAWLHPYPTDTGGLFPLDPWGTTILWIVILPVAALQSYRLFRALHPAGWTSTIRHIVVLAVLAGVAGFVQFTPFAILYRTNILTYRLLRETAQAIRVRHWVTDRQAQSQPVPLETLTDGDRTSPPTHAVLMHSKVLTHGAANIPAQWVKREISVRRGQVYRTPPAYWIEVQFANSWSCTMPEQFGEHDFNEFDCVQGDGGLLQPAWNHRIWSYLGTNAYVYGNGLTPSSTDERDRQ